MASLEQAIPPILLFRFAIPLRYHPQAGLAGRVDWTEDEAIPAVGELTGRRPFGRVFGVWSENGLTFAFSVTQRSKPLWCRATRTASSDRVELFINTRPAAMSRRLTPFCVGITAMPIGNPAAPGAPYVECHCFVNPHTIVGPEYVHATSAVDGHDYLLSVAIGARGLPGFDPQHEPRVGFMCVFHDVVFGTEAFAGLPVQAVGQDPSLWVMLELTC